MESNQNISISQQKSSESSIAMDSCRVCMVHRLETSMDFEDIFDSSIPDKLQFSTGLQVLKDDGLPTLICMACLEGLDSAHTFKTVCLESNDAYREMQLLIKRESVDHDHDYNIVLPIQDGIMRDSPEGVSFTMLEDCGLSDEDEMLAAVLKQCDGAEQKSKDAEKILDLRRPLGGQDSENNIISGPALDVEVRKPKTRGKRGKYKKKQKGEIGAPPATKPPPKILRFFCELCQIQFSSRKLKEEHKKLMHKETYCCELCGELFSSYAAHNHHLTRHGPPIHSCDQCAYATWCKNDLKKHLNMHSAVKQYKCELCPAAYVCLSNLRAHTARTHDQVKPLACHLCPMRFYNKYQLREHMDRQHKRMRRVVCCELCTKHFSNSQYWRKHMVEKHGEDPPIVKPGRKKSVGLGAGSPSPYVHKYVPIRAPVSRRSRKK